jgi:predicted RNA-binding protein with PUA-like domain
MAKPAAVVGVAEVVREAYPDLTAFDTKNEYYDPKSKREDPTWFMVDIRGVEALQRAVPIDEIKKTKGLEKMALVRLGRLSVQPVTEKEWEIVQGLARKRLPGSAVAR